LLAFGADRVRVEHVHQLLGTANEERLAELVDALLARDAATAIRLVDQAEREGVHLGALVDQLIEYYRDLTVARAAGGDSELLCTATRLRDRLIEQSKRTSLHTLLAAADILAELKGRLRGSEHGRLLMDLALVRIGHLEELTAIGELIDRLASAEPQHQHAAAEAASGPSAGTAPAAAASGGQAGKVKKNAGRQTAVSAPHARQRAERNVASSQRQPAAETAGLGTASDLATGTATSAGTSRSTSTLAAPGRQGRVGTLTDRPEPAPGGATETPGSTHRPHHRPIEPPEQAEPEEAGVSDRPPAAGPGPMDPEQACRLVRERAANLMPMLAEAVNRAELEARPEAGLVLLHLDPIYSGSSIGKKVEEALQHALGGKLQVRVDVQQNAGAKDRQRPDRASYSDLLNQVAQDPLVQKAIETMGAKVLKIRGQEENGR
jgi:DNA polymerase-3 subunit gamma/tau